MNTKRRLLRASEGAALFFLAALLRATTPPVAAPLEPAVFLAADKAGERVVVVGERGMIRLSDDRGTSWRSAPVPVNVKRRLDLADDFGLMVKDVADNCPARKYIAPGDLIVQMNQTPINSLTDAGLALEKLSRGDGVSIIGYRLRRDTPVRWHVTLPSMK